MALTLMHRPFRMGLDLTDTVKESIEIFKEALKQEPSIQNKDFKSSLYLGYALAAQRLGDIKLAQKNAVNTLGLCHADSNNAFQAKAILIETSQKGQKKYNALRQLYKRAKHKKAFHACDNIAIELAKDGDNVEESIKMLDSVIQRARDKYNLSRAIVDKAELLKKINRLSELSESESSLLNFAYGYSYGQRIGGILDRCHDVLWSHYLARSVIASLLRLFRFSSFWWRFKGGAEDERERQFIDELDPIAREQLDQQTQTELRIELIYFRTRKNHFE